jgi:transposase, IS5 family
MKGEEKTQDDLFSASIYEARIRKDHFLRRLKVLLDWHDLASELNDCYRHKGRPSVPPEMMLKIMILQFLYDLSDRQFEEQLRYRLDFMYFLGLSLDEAGPDHSTLSRFRGRVGAERFARIFNKIVAEARREGLISDRLHAIDSRHFKANVSTWRQRDRNSDDNDDTPSGFVLFDDSPPGSPDPDARWGKKSKHYSFYGYKHHMAVDADSGLIVTSVVTPGNDNDGAVMATVLDDAAGAVVADKAYDLPCNHQLLSAKRIGNRILIKGVDNGTKNAGRYVVERTNAVVKRWCGGGRARYWGLEKVSIQMTLASIAANLKRWLSTDAPVAVQTG